MDDLLGIKVNRRRTHSISLSREQAQAQLLTLINSKRFVTERRSIALAFVA